MTWLPLHRPGEHERRAVFALQPGASDLWLAVLARTWSITDPDLLELCRLRIAQMHGCHAELDVAGPGQLERLDSRDALPLRERAALAYAEQFVVDQNGITDEQKADLSQCLSDRELANFVQALNTHDGYCRTLSLLDVRADAADSAGRPLEQAASRPGDPRGVPRGTAGLERFEALTDTAFYEARAAFGAATALLDGVDEVTTEICRLRNASHQACRF